MARVTVEDCLEHVENRFVLVHVASRRVRQLEKGAYRMIGSKNKNIVESLREIAFGKVRRLEASATEEEATEE